MDALIIGTSEIRQLDGLYSLNDLHKSAGSESKHRPNYFLDLQQTKELVGEIEIAGIPAISAKPKIGTYVCKELVIAYAAWISAEFHLKVIRFFLDHNIPKQEPAATLPKSFAEALRIAADLEEKKAIAEQERDEAIRTKAMIGSRREAKAMAAVSVQKRRADALEVKLDEHDSWATVKRMEDQTGLKFNWRVLKKTAEELGIYVKKAHDENYGEVNSYHDKVWKHAYNVSVMGA